MFPRFIATKAAEFTALVVVGLIATAPILYPVFTRARENARRSSCQSNLKQIGLAFQMYRADHDCFPADRQGKSGLGWTETLMPYTKTVVLYHCPTTPDGPVVGDYVGAARTDYFMNRRFSARRDAPSTGAPSVEAGGSAWDAAAHSILIGDGQAGITGSAGNYSLSALPAAWRTGGGSPSARHLEGANYGFADGHVKWLRPERVHTTAVREGQATFAVK